MSAAAVVEHAGDVTVLRLTAGENRFNPEVLDAIEGALDEIEATEGPAALVITGEGKFFSIGLDLDWMAAAPPGGADELLARVHRLLARVLVFPAATMAAINGHAFAAGGMLALACDRRVMREDRGYVCMPEVDIGLVFTPGMTALLRARLPAATAHEAMVTGRRYGAREAVAAGFVDDAVPGDRVLAAAIEHAAALAGKPRATLAAIKHAIYGDVVAALHGGSPAEPSVIERAAATVRHLRAGAQ